jgi:hypothetical protein
MMEIGRESCEFAGENYSQGSEIFILRKCLICLDGKWREKEYEPDSPISRPKPGRP